MLSLLEQIENEVKKLPLSAQVELLHYAVYLLEKNKEKPVLVSAEEKRAAFAAALENACAINPFAAIADPVAWQKELREDRRLPGRGDAD